MVAIATNQNFSLYTQIPVSVCYSDSEVFRNLDSFQIPNWGLFFYVGAPDLQQTADASPPKKFQKYWSRESNSVGASVCVGGEAFKGIFFLGFWRLGYFR